MHLNLFIKLYWGFQTLSFYRSIDAEMAVSYPSLKQNTFALLQESSSPLSDTGKNVCTSHRWDCWDFVYVLVAYRSGEFAGPESSVSSVTYLKLQVGKLFAKRCYMETEYSCRRKGEKQHSLEGGLTTPRHFCQELWKGLNRNSYNRNCPRLPLTFMVALYDRNPLYPLGNERQCRTRCQETRCSLVGLSGEAGQLH